MGSSWTEAVWLKGLGDAGITLAAPGAVVNPNYWLTNQPAPAGLAWLWYVAQNSVPNDTYGRTTVVKHAPHFPYGYPVAPPSPV